MTSGLYVYGIVDTGALDGQIRARGVDPRHPPALFEVGDLTAVVSEVDVTEFEGEALERNAMNPDWLEAKVRGHESVLDEVITNATVVPMRFGSIFSTAHGLRTMLVGHAGPLGASLERVRGRSEWGVKVHCDPRRLVDRLAGATREGPPGRAYLMQRKAELHAQDEAAEVAAAAAAEIHSSLATLSDDATTMAPRGTDRAMVVLNGAYLVDDGERETFMQRVQALQKSHGDSYMFEVTGPWPPYNFTSADVTGSRS